MTLHFAETYPVITTGDRLFTVTVGNAPCLTSFDQYRAAGDVLNTPVTRTCRTRITDTDTLLLTFDHVKENPAIKGIEIAYVPRNGDDGAP